MNTVIAVADRLKETISQSPEFLGMSSRGRDRLLVWAFSQTVKGGHEAPEPTGVPVGLLSMARILRAMEERINGEAS